MESILNLNLENRIHVYQANYSQGKSHKILKRLTYLDIWNPSYWEKMEKSHRY